MATGDIVLPIVLGAMVLIQLGLSSWVIAHKCPAPKRPPIIFPRPRRPCSQGALPPTLNDAVFAINEWNNDRPDWAFKMVQADDEYSQHETKRRD